LKEYPELLPVYHPMKDCRRMVLYKP